MFVSPTECNCKQAKVTSQSQLRHKSPHKLTDTFKSFEMTNIMNHDFAGNSSSLDKRLNPEQFDQLVEAILAGKYSWACVLMLRFAGYNPLHYIPYRTYNRLLKENSSVNRAKQHTDSPKIAKLPVDRRSDSNVSSSCLNKIKDLAYLEVVGKKKTEIRGGSFQQWLSTKIHEYQSIRSELNPESSQDLPFSFCESH
jgi:hypothetical protein